MKNEKILGEKLDSSKVEQSLTMIGLEVEEVQKWDFSKLDPKIVVGEIEKIEKHPNADKLQICLVNTGKEKLSIICGANNINQGDFVPVATIGAKLDNSESFPEGIKIKKTKIRGIESSGMLCSLNELSVNDSSNGIFLLSNNLVHGSPISKIENLDDTIFDDSITPNRAYSLTFYRIARELSSKLN